MLYLPFLVGITTLQTNEVPDREEYALIEPQDVFQESAEWEFVEDGVEVEEAVFLPQGSETNQQPLVDQPMVDQAPVEQSTIEQPTIEQPMVDQPGVDPSEVNQSVLDNSKDGDLLMNQPQVDEPDFDEKEDVENTPPGSTDSVWESRLFGTQQEEDHYLDENDEQPVPDFSSHPTTTVTLSHIEGKGIGYPDGYTTLELFYTPEVIPFMPWIDIRGHVFDNGKFAGNAGMGMRYLGTRIRGAYAYYDYRKTHRHQYNQISVGYEDLGRVDFRINGYLPIGDTHSSPFHPEFYSFKGNSLIISTKREFAMPGVNAEVGTSFSYADDIGCYAAIGPYYFGAEGRNALGAEARIAASFWDYIEIEASGSYDQIFGWIGQGRLSITIPFGPQEKSSQRRRLPKVTAHVDRNEIIVIDRRHKKSAAIDPATGEPYTIWFVDNTSHSQGTYESPFNALQDAQLASSPNDIIYVFPGDGTDNMMSDGITLKDNQRFLGSGIPHNFNTTYGMVTAPALSTTAPLISNNSNTAAWNVLMANNNEVSGFSIQTQAINFPAIGSTNGITNPSINYCDLTLTGLSSQGGIVFSSSSQLGTVNINRVNINDLNFDNLGIFLDNNQQLNALNISNCALSTDQSGIRIENSDQIGAIKISNCAFITNDDESIYILFNNTLGSINITDCPITSSHTGIRILDNTSIGAINVNNCAVKAQDIGVFIQTNVSIDTIDITNCVLSSVNPPQAGVKVTHTSQLGSLNFSGNTVLIQAGNPCIDIDNITQLGNVSITNSSFLGLDMSSTTGLNLGTLSNGSILVKNNVFSGIDSSHGLRFGITALNPLDNVTLLVQNNQFSMATNGQTAIALDPTNAIAPWSMMFNATGNQMVVQGLFANTTGISIDISAGGFTSTGPLCASILDNQAVVHSGINSYGYFIDNQHADISLFLLNFDSTNTGTASIQNVTMTSGCE